MDERCPPKVWLLALDGQERDAASLTRRLPSRGFQADLIGLNSHGPIDAGTIWEPNLSRPWLRPWGVRRLVAGAGDNPPSLIYSLDMASAPAALSLAEAFAIPYIQALDRFPDERRGLKVGRCRCARLVASTEAAAEAWRVDAGVPRAALAIIGPGLAALPDDPRAPLAHDKRPVIGLFARRAIDLGDLAFLNAARAILEAGHDAEFVVVADDHEPFRVQAARLGLQARITFADHDLGPDAIGRLLDLVCLPSLADEVDPSLPEAQAAGRAIVASDIAVHHERIAPERDGLLVPAGNPEALASAVLRLLRSPEEAARLGQAARQTAAIRYDPEREADDLAALYRSCLGPPDDSHRSHGLFRGLSRRGLQRADRAPIRDSATFAAQRKS